METQVQPAAVMAEPPKPRSSWRVMFLGALIGVLFTTGALGSYRFLSRERPVHLEGVEIFGRRTRDGVRIRASLGPRELDPFRADCQGGCPPCAVNATLFASFDNNRAYGFGGARFSSARVATLDINGPSAMGVPGRPVISVVGMHATSDVAKVRVTWASGASDEMEPVDGWAVLAAYGLLDRPIFTAYDASGTEIGRIADNDRPSPVPCSAT